MLANRCWQDTLHCSFFLLSWKSDACFALIACLSLITGPVLQPMKCAYPQLQLREAEAGCWELERRKLELGCMKQAKESVSFSEHLKELGERRGCLQEHSSRDTVP